MKIKQLELTGFKSFVDKTAIEFPDGVTGIVGPNGCGKSNIVDAIRWVLGEQSYKNLRGKSMEDVIFNGSESRAATGMAEVQIIFDNSDGRVGGAYSSFSEIAVGRRLFRSGESEYLINRSPARLKDIQEIFMDTGVGARAHYSIIEQGKVGLVLSAKAEDRRVLIEEAAGISKYRSRKEAALRKIESTQQNLLRVSDVVAEVKRQIDYTQRQAQKAKKHMTLKEEALGLEAVLWKVDYREAHGIYAKVDGEITAETGREEALKGQISSLELTIERLRLELTDAEKTLQGIQERFQANQGQIRLLENNLEHHAENLRQIQERRAKVQGDLEQDRGSEQTTRLALEQTQKELAQAQALDADLARALALAEKHLFEIETESQAAHKRTESLREQGTRLAGRIANGEAALGTFERRRNDLNDAIARTQEEQRAVEANLAELKPALRGLEEKLSGAQQLHLELKSRAEASQERLQSWIVQEAQLERDLLTHRERMATLKSRLHVLEELQAKFEGLQDGVRSIMLHRREQGVLGLLADVLSVPKAYEQACEAVLGQRLESIVVRDAHEAFEAIDYLKRQAAGRGAFVPLSLRRSAAMPPAAWPSIEGVAGRLLDLVNYAPEYATVAEHLLGSVVVVRDLSLAQTLWQSGQGFTFVTLDGDVLDDAGVVTGGRHAQAAADSQDASVGIGASNLLRRKRAIQDLQGEIQTLQTTVVTVEAELVDLARRIEQSKREAEGLRRDSHQEELQVVSQQKDFAQLREEIRRLEENLGKLRDRAAQEQSTLADLKHEEEGVRASLETARREKTTSDADFEAAKAQWLDLTQRLGGLKDETTQVRVRLAEVRQQCQSSERDTARLEKDLQDAVIRQQNLQRDIEKSFADEESLKLKSAETEESIRGLLTVNDDIEVQLRQERNAFDERHVGLQEKESSLRARMHEHEEVISRLSQLRIRQAEFKMKVDGLEEQARARHNNIDIKLLVEEALAAQADAAAEISDIQETREKLAELQKQLENLGEVNLASISELEELTERHLFLMRQKEDLEISIDALQKTIHKVNRTSRERFKETFDAVNAKFQEIFPRLFGGGKASLLLTNEEDLLETGVDILCQPPGKKIQNVVLLSGGEKALASICLILAIFLIKPSPFCLLDEVDAPLDDANIFRFNDLLHEIAKESQLILITHNRNTMEIADYLYGVTMQEAGVSRMVSVSLK